MIGSSLEDSMFADLEPIVTGSGLDLVDLRAQIVRDSLHVHVVIHRASGVGINDCAQIHRMVVPRLEAAHPERDLYVEVGSPGIERSIRLPREYRIFRGKGVRVYSKSRGAWIGGVIGECDSNTVSITTADAVLQVQYDDIQKARLDDSQEV
jgi:ribosome maturation factor RimP